MKFNRANLILIVSALLILGLVSCLDKETQNDVEENSGHRFIQIEPNSYRISATGFGTISFGMSEAEAVSVANILLARPDYLSQEKFWEDEKDCFYLESETLKIGVMILDGTVQRFDVWDSYIETEKGAKIGMTFGDVENLYTDTRRKPNFYSAPLEDLIVTLNEDTKIIFEQRSSEFIHSFRIGKLPAIDFVEGCL